MSDELKALEAKLAAAEAKVTTLSSELAATKDALTQVTSSKRELEPKAAQVDALTAKVTDLEKTAAARAERVALLEFGAKAGIAAGKLDAAVALAKAYGGALNDKGEFVVPDDALKTIRADAPGCFVGATTTTTTPAPTGAGTPPNPGEKPPPTKPDYSTPEGQRAARRAALERGAAAATQ
jgi:uncharacterized coiled-coil protein SlyX